MAKRLISITLLPVLLTLFPAGVCGKACPFTASSVVIDKLSPALHVNSPGIYRSMRTSRAKQSVITEGPQEIPPMESKISQDIGLVQFDTLTFRFYSEKDRDTALSLAIQFFPGYGKNGNSVVPSVKELHMSSFQKLKDYLADYNGGAKKIGALNGHGAVIIPEEGNPLYLMEYRQNGSGYLGIINLVTQRVLRVVEVKFAGNGFSQEDGYDLEGLKLTLHQGVVNEEYPKVRMPRVDEKGNVTLVEVIGHGAPRETYFLGPDTAVDISGRQMPQNRPDITHFENGDALETWLRNVFKKRIAGNGQNINGQYRTWAGEIQKIIPSGWREGNVGIDSPYMNPLILVEIRQADKRVIQLINLASMEVIDSLELMDGSQYEIKEQEYLSKVVLTVTGQDPVIIRSRGFISANEKLKVPTGEKRNTAAFSGVTKDIPIAPRAIPAPNVSLSARSI